MSKLLWFLWYFLLSFVVTDCALCLYARDVRSLYSAWICFVLWHLVDVHRASSQSSFKGCADCERAKTEVIYELKKSTKYLKAFADCRGLLASWANKQGHDSCWYYPDIFNKLVVLMDIKINRQPTLSLGQFQAGCKKYQSELYTASSSNDLRPASSSMISTTDHNIKMNQMRDACIPHTVYFLDRKFANPEISADCEAYVRRQIASINPTEDEEKPEPKYPIILPKETTIWQKRRVLREELRENLSVVEWENSSAKYAPSAGVVVITRGNENSYRSLAVFLSEVKDVQYTIKTA